MYNIDSSFVSTSPLPQDDAVCYLTGGSISLLQLLTDNFVVFSKSVKCVCKLKELLQQVIQLRLQMQLRLQENGISYNCCYWYSYNRSWLPEACYIAVADTTA